jgi:hypothetical protein
LMTKWRTFKNFLQLSITFIHRKTTKELWTTCTCNFMTLRVLMMKKRHWQVGNEHVAKMWPHEQKQVNLRFKLRSEILLSKLIFIYNCLYWISRLFGFDKFANAVIVKLCEFDNVPWSWFKYSKFSSRGQASLWPYFYGYYYNKEWGIGKRNQGTGNAKTRNTKSRNL